MVKIKTVEAAADIALPFIKEYYPCPRLEKSERNNGIWTLQFDVGMFHPDIKVVKIDAETGNILSLQTPIIPQIKSACIILRKHLGLCAEDVNNILVQIKQLEEVKNEEISN